MQLFLRSQRLWDVVQQQVPIPSSPPTLDDERWARKNSNALSMIVLRVDDHQLGLLRNVHTAFEAWKVLRNANVNRSMSHRITLLRQLSNRKCGSLRYLDEYVETFQDTVWQLEVIGIDIPEELLIAMLLNALPRSYAYFNMMVESKDEVPSLSQLIIDVKEERDRQKFARDVRIIRERPGRCLHCGRTTHTSRHCRKFIHGRYAM